MADNVCASNELKEHINTLSDVVRNLPTEPIQDTPDVRTALSFANQYDLMRSEILTATASVARNRYPDNPSVGFLTTLLVDMAYLTALAVMADFANEHDKTESGKVLSFCTDFCKQEAAHHAALLVNLIRDNRTSQVQCNEDKLQ